MQQLAHQVLASTCMAPFIVPRVQAIGRGCKHGHNWRANEPRKVGTEKLFMALHLPCSVPSYFWRHSSWHSHHVGQGCAFAGVSCSWLNFVRYSFNCRCALLKISECCKKMLGLAINGLGAYFWHLDLQITPVDLCEPGIKCRCGEGRISFHTRVRFPW